MFLIVRPMLLLVFVCLLTLDPSCVGATNPSPAQVKYIVVWRPRETSRDQQRPLETKGDHWRPCETPGVQQRSLETKGDQ